MYGKGLIKGLGITLKHHFNKKLSQQYPEERPYLQKRFRGRLYLEFDKCMACGICIRSCPNGVLSLEDARDEVTKKKKLMSYTIDHQYCMFCNLCVESCTLNCLHFNHDFELASYQREDIKTVYRRPPEMDKQEATPITSDSSGVDGTKHVKADKKEKQLKALFTAYDKSPQKLLAKYVESEEQTEILVQLLQADRKKAEKILGIMVDDKDKAKKIAQAMVNKELKQSQVKKEGGTEQ
ncbi:MAG: 4Fe-4S binding protein [Syntrophomonadaceae bacterium]|jgi:NADH-quinone oxidoreductase subunit I